MMTTHSAFHAASINSPTLSVLVVEDCEDGADSLSELLQMHGHRVRLARTGSAALELAFDEPPDVAILDVLLPDLSGWEVARWLREQSIEKHPFLIAVTGCTTEDARLKSEKAGIDLHLVKPVDPAVLIGVLNRFARVVG